MSAKTRCGENLHSSMRATDSRGMENSCFLRKLILEVGWSAVTASMQDVEQTTGHSEGQPHAHGNSQGRVLDESDLVVDASFV